MAGRLRKAARRGLQNATLKGLSVGLAVLLFVFVRGDREEEAGLTVAVVMETDPSRVLVSEPIDRLKVKLRGKASKVRKAMTEALDPVRVKLSDQSDGEYVFARHEIHLPAGVRVVQVRPASTVLRFEPSVHREVEIEAALTGAYDRAFVLTGRKVTPSTVRVRGAKSAVLELKRIRTLPIDVTGRWENSVVEVGLVNPGRHLVFDPEPKRVRVRLKFEQRVGEKDFVGVPVQLVGATRYATSVKPDKATVRLDGPLKVLRGLSPEEIEASIDVNEFDEQPPGTHRKTLTMGGLPPGVGLVRTRPKSFLVTTEPRAEPTAASPEAAPAGVVPKADPQGAGTGPSKAPQGDKG